MVNTKDILSIVRGQGLVPLFYHEDPTICEGITNALYEGGIRILEFTNRGPKALENFRVLRQLVNEKLPGMLLGIGTIKTEKDASAFIEAGADFIISPIVHPGIAALTQAAGLMWVPGCLTPTEIALAETAGAKLVKVFPGSLVGPSYISAIKDIFPDILFMPTGGVDITKENISAWFKAGVVAVGMGSKLITKEILDKASYKALSAASAEALAIVHSVKN
ncbi:MAG: bifunctional 4-hydroxy-2-oxoglutarate aldolase/2-dehydro-3-deoxy-phosphogluconate aldolase [Chitinophagaceae bacterium]|nr:MAG: bifunctional 4-hydroxy-2-oxoglutarate aldolase/2-dehydro-3-deoxy-phosphogluconate aldolase [Chitinophagaceae bacterium]